MYRDGVLLPRHLPLMLASKRFATPDEPEPLDRVRMQKAIFLLERRGPAEWRSFYEFRPYNWGPFSRDLARDLDELLAEGLMESHLPGQYEAYKTTEAGETVVDPIAAMLDTARQMYVRHVRKFVTSRSFKQLLRDVYAAYPEFAVRSRFSS